MKKLMTIFLSLTMLLTTCAQATIIPSAGQNEDMGVWTGYTPAYILCQSLSVYDARGDQGGKKVGTLKYSKDAEPIPVLQSWDGWAEVGYDDGNKTGWVHNEYLLMNPDWYVCDKGTAVYAYDDTMAPRVAWVDEGTRLAIIRDLGDWVQVSIRTATGYIKKTPADTADETWFRPQMLADLASAELVFNGESLFLVDPEPLSELSALLVNANDLGGPMAGCPFTAALNLTLRDGTVVEMDLATDSCCAYSVDGRHYAYARHLRTEDNGVDNSCLYSLFGVSVFDLSGGDRR